MGNKPQAVRLDGVHHKWIKLLTHAQNSTLPVHRFTFPSEDVAKTAYYRLCDSRNRDTWFRLEILRKGRDVYIVKSDAIQKVVVLV